MLKPQGTRSPPARYAEALIGVVAITEGDITEPSCAFHNVRYAEASVH
jgi:hypothetical protein